MPLPTETPADGGGTTSVLGAAGVTETPAVGSDAPWSGDDTWKIGEGDDAKEWFDLIPEEKVREGIKAKGYKNPAELAVAYNALMAKQRNPDSTIVVPGEDATPEEQAAFNKAFGVPESKDGFEFKAPEGVEHDPEMIEFFKSTAHKAGLNPKQANAVVQEWDAMVLEASKTQAEAKSAETEAVKEKYGEELPKIQAQGQRAVKALGLSTETIAALDANMGTAAVVELLAKLGGAGGEAAFKAAGAGGEGVDGEAANMTPAQAKAKIDELMGDEKFQAKYTDGNHPEHKQALKRMERLFAKT